MNNNNSKIIIQTTIIIFTIIKIIQKEKAMPIKIIITTTHIHFIAHLKMHSLQVLVVSQHLLCVPSVSGDGRGGRSPPEGVIANSGLLSYFGRWAMIVAREVLMLALAIIIGSATTNDDGFVSLIQQWWWLMYYPSLLGSERGEGILLLAVAIFANSQQSA
jgi:hypothetical protein